MKAHPLKRYIFENNLWQRDVAEELGISEAHLSGILSGRAHPGRETALRIWELYQIPLDELLSWEPK